MQETQWFPESPSLLGPGHMTVQSVVEGQEAKEHMEASKAAKPVHITLFPQGRLYEQRQNMLPQSYPLTHTLYCEDK